MQGLVCWKGRSLVLLLLLALLPLANGTFLMDDREYSAVRACEFPAGWAGQWFQSGKPSPVTINATNIGERTCVEKKGDMYVVYDNSSSGENYNCLIINDRHTNVIQFREVGYGHRSPMKLEEMCQATTTDDSLFTMFRLNPTPIPCPFQGPPFTFTYNRGTGECAQPISHAEGCTEESKLLLKYQACPDVPGSESNTEELQCLATWKDGRNRYLVGTLKLFGRNAVTNEETFRCFLYEKNTHHRDVTYVLAQSGDSTCSALNSVAEGSRTIKLTKVDREHNRCKYPAWVTVRHQWRTLDHSRNYHFTTGNATLRVKDDHSHVERIVCHNLESGDDDGRNKVKLVAHITKGCDIGYVCMIFHRRAGNVIELQQSDRKTIVPEEACQEDLSDMPFTTLISSTMEKRKCPQPGRYTVIDYSTSGVLSTTPRRQRRGTQGMRPAQKLTWQEDSEDEECNVSSLQIGCGSSDQSEMIIANTCERDELVYTCHDSWQDKKGTHYMIVSQPEIEPGVVKTFCFTMRWEDPPSKSLGGRASRLEHQQQELWLSRPAREFQTGPNDQWTYRLASQGICKDMTRASAASSSSLSRVSLVLSAGAAILCKLLSR
ncbi:uncharacterized protein [Fopius arisanus]|uniref:EmbB_1 protein n=1 Tax=Fopius arisanus TaxID=64838 RepID=A0A0C9PJ82_9HYME|nr:PREDICTED: uncharacterized protein LOC105274171 isoform X1 [Fopius arisanus]